MLPGSGTATDSKLKLWWQWHGSARVCSRIRCPVRWRRSRSEIKGGRSSRVGPSRETRCGWPGGTTCPACLIRVVARPATYSRAEERVKVRRSLWREIAGRLTETADHRLTSLSTAAPLAAETGSMPTKVRDEPKPSSGRYRPRRANWPDGERLFSEVRVPARLTL